MSRVHDALAMGLAIALTAAPAAAAEPPEPKPDPWVAAGLAVGAPLGVYAL